MPDVVAFRPDSCVPPRMDLHERARLDAASRHAVAVLPGAVGRYISAELAWWAQQGWRLNPDATVQQLATQVLAMPRPTPDAA